VAESTKQTNGEPTSVGTAVMNASQDAAEMARTTAQKAADKMPDAVASVQDAATETQRRLDEMPNDALVIGTSFSLGMAAALFLSGANRFVVAIAALPAIAMALTVVNRNHGPSATAASVRRAARTAAND
jgi:hypothetical protein